jgi:hypothetical protein
MTLKCLIGSHKLIWTIIDRQEISKISTKNLDLNFNTPDFQAENFKNRGLQSKKVSELEVYR